MSISICVRYLFLLVFPSIFPSIVSRNSDSCRKKCPIHLRFRCCTMFKISWAKLHQRRTWNTDTFICARTLTNIIIIIIIIMTHRQLLSVATTLHDVHVPLHSSTPVSSWLLFHHQSAVSMSFDDVQGVFIAEQRPAFIAMTCFRAWCAGMLASITNMDRF